MNWLPTLIAALSGLSLGAGPSQAATVIYTNRAAFEAGLPAGFYFNNFSTTANAFDSPVSMVTGSGGSPPVGYEITAPTAGLGVFPDAGFKAIGNWNAAQDLIVTFNSGNVVSAGANVWLTDLAGNRLAGTLTVNFSEGTSIPVSSTTSGPFGFAGLTTTETILTTLTLQAASGSYLNFSDFSVAAVPEPSIGALLLLAGAGWLLWPRRKANL